MCMCYAVYAGKNKNGGLISTKESKNVFVRTNGLEHLARSGNGEHAGAAAHPLKNPHGGDDGVGGGAQRAASSEPHNLHYPKEKNRKRKEIKMTI